MMRVALNFVGDSSGLGISIPKSDAFSGKIKYGEYEIFSLIN